MFDRWLKLPAHKYLHLTSLFILVVGVNFSNVLMSIGAIWIVSNALIQADFKTYATRIKSNKFLWILIAFIILNFLSILWSDDIAYAIKDLRMKLPLFAIPLAMGIQKKLEEKELKWLLITFIVAVTLASIINFITYDKNLDIREMSRFVSHVRFSVAIAIAMTAAVYLMLKQLGIIWLYGIAVLWLLFYTYYSQVLTGYALTGILFISVIYYFFRKLGWSVWTITASLLIIGVSLGFYLNSRVNKILHTEMIKFSDLELYSPSGNPYYHDTLNNGMENGNFIWLYVQHDEMRKEWNKVSPLDYDGEDKIGQPLYGTIMRYLTSMGERKDSSGIAHLSNIDIERIENGKTSCESDKGIFSRMDALLTEVIKIREHGDPNGSSLLQRMEHLRIATLIIKKNWLFGVGVGDVPITFEKAYETYHSELNEEHRWRSHNQFLTTWIGLGILGLLLYAALIFYFFFTLSRKDFLFTNIIIYLALSSFFQDIIETQAGVTLFALFLAFAIHAIPIRNVKLRLVKP